MPAFGKVDVCAEVVEDRVGAGVHPLSPTTAVSTMTDVPTADVRDRSRIHARLLRTAEA